MYTARNLFAFLFSAAIPIPLFFYIPGFTFYLERSYVLREGGSALLPICFLPLFFLLVLNFKQIVKYLLHPTPFRGLLALVAITLISSFNGVAPLFSLQLIAGLILVYIWPIMIGYFTVSCLWAALFSAASFALLHLYDTGYIFSNLAPSSLSFWEYPYIYGYFIYHSYVSFPEVLVSVSASGLALSSLLLSRLDRFSAVASAFLSLIVLAYALSYGRASTIFAVIVSISLSALTVLWPLTYSIRVSTKLLRLLIYIAITVLVFSIAFPFVATFIDFAYTRFVMRAFDQGGSDRLDVWNHFFDSFAGADPLSILFGSNLSGAHNLFLDLLVRVGVVGLALFIFSLFTGLRIFFMSARDSGIAIFPPSVPLILFFSIAVVGNIFNVSLTQPWPIASYLFFWAASSMCSLAAHKARRGVAMSNIAPL